MEELRGKSIDERKYYNFFRSNYDELLSFTKDQQLEFCLAVLKYNLTDVAFDDIEIKDSGLKMFWRGIRYDQIISRNKFVKNNEKGEPTKPNSKKDKKPKKPKETKKETKPKVDSKSTVKTNPVEPEVINQPAEVVETTQPENTEVENTEITENKDLSKENTVSFIHLNLNIDAGLALQIYQYRVLKKVSNSEVALERFCQQIKNGVDKSDVPIVGVVDYYCKGAWLEFKKTWVEDSIALANFADDIVAHENLEVVAPEVVAPVVDVADKTVSLILKHLPISRDYAENIVKFKKNYNQLDNDVSLLTWCREINKASDMAERPVNDVLDFIFMKNWKTFSAVWFVNHVTEETEAMKKKKYSDKVNPLTAPGLSHLSQGEKEKLIRDKRANNIRMGIPNRDDEDSSRVFREKGSNNLITMEQNNE
jgi:hypothetical protein